MKSVVKKAFSFLLLVLAIISLFFLFRWIINSNKSEKNLENKNDDKNKPNNTQPLPDSSLPPTDTENWWLTDEEIEYAYKEMEKGLGNSSEIKLVSPSVARVIQEGGGINEDLKQEKIIFFPINNSESHETGDSGSHWTLLVGDNRGKSGAFSHYNSAGSTIPANARELAEKFCEKVGVEEEFLPPTIYNDHDCPQQTNGSDCGVFVIAFTRALIREYKKNAFDRNLSLKEESLIFSVAEERQKLKDAGFPKKGSDGGNYDIGDDVEYLESEENRILEWYENPDTPLRKSIEFEWDYNSLGLPCSATKSERARSLQEFSKKIRLLSGVGKIEKEKLKKIYKVKKTLKYCSLSPEEYDNSQPPMKYIDGWVSTADEFNEINNLYKIHFPRK